MPASGAPRWLQRMVRRYTSFDPDKRYSTVAALETVLRRGAYHTRRLAVACCVVALLCCTAILATVGLERGEAAYTTEAGKRIMTFAEPLIEHAIAYQPGKDPGMITEADLLNVHSLLLGGNMPCDYWGGGAVCRLGQNIH